MIRSVKFSASNLLVIAIFFPFFKNFLSSTALSQMFAVGVLIIFSGGFLLTKVRKPLKFNFFPSIFTLAFTITFLGSIYYESSILRTFSDSFRYLVFAWFFIIGYNYNSLKDQEFLELIMKLACLQVIVCFFVFIEPLHAIVDLFKGRLSTDDMSFHFYRFSGTLGYPTEFACFLFLPIMHLIRSNLFIVNWRNFIIFCICSLGILLSVSRGGLLVLGIFLLMNMMHRFLLLIAKMKLNKKVAILTFIASVSIVFVLQFFTGSSDTLTIAGYFFSIFNNIDSSILHRFNELQISLSILSGNTVVPIQEARIEPFGLDSIESFWGSSVIRFGWLGLVIVILLTLSFIYKYLSLEKFQKHSFSGSVVLWFCMIYLFISPFSEVIFRSKGSVIFALILGTALNCLNIDINRSKSFHSKLLDMK